MCCVRVCTTHSELGKLKATQCRSNKMPPKWNCIIFFSLSETKNAFAHESGFLQRDAEIESVQIPEFAMTKIFILVTIAKFLFCISVFRSFALKYLQNSEKKMCL